MNDLTLTLIQPNPAWEDIKQNLRHLSGMIAKAPPHTHLILLPEMFSTGFTMKASTLAQTMDGEAVTWMKDQAAQTKAVVAGSLLIRENDQYYNRFVWMTPDGQIAFYNKRHLFRMVNEQETISMGRKSTIVELKGWKINLQVCYDLRFPVWSRNRYQNGQYDYDLLLYVANWPAVRHEAYKTLLPARAIENQAWVAWVNRIGKDGNDVEHTGDSAIYDPRGRQFARADKSTEALVTATLPGNLLPEFRKKFAVGYDWDDFSIVK